ncbi:hypothetical protein DAPPUDRAFT_117019 [Daphnia pulex]|uniref:Ubiquitin-like protease family profile domain-containing protein n=1 Tax=Daphnia pulex TaxID=6669 RepID=E9HR93_DAPPU|nr:hypothetical protein DAPPUDRAFT_117019 [Daphnia pulex]|eukprot:EFX65750.1 hypothetical protein DAPPUDRAFT_117019 [Daphnia pulex]
MGESSSKSEISVNSNQRSVSVQETKDILVSENIQPKLLKHNSNSKGIKKITIQEYRKQIGHKVINQKSTQKLGITAKQESNSEEKCRGQSPDPDSANCPHCGHLVSTNKCMKCMRVFEKEKTVHLTSNLKSLPGNKSSGISQMSNDSSYGYRRTRTQNAQPSRQSRAKFEEPQCVTLSSDEDDDSFQETKKLKCDGTDKSTEKLDVNPSIVIQEQPNIKECEPLNGVSMDLPIDAEEEIGSSDLLRWKEGGLNGPFFAVNCRSVRIGSYKITPVGRVLFSSEGIMLQAPVFHNHDGPSEKSAVWVNVAIPSEQLLKVDAYFSRKLQVIFLNVGPSWCRQLSTKLGLTKSGPYWDSASEDENKKRLTLLPDGLDDAAKNAIKQVFVPQGVYNEINQAEANRLLVISSPPEVRDALKRLPATTAVSAETSVSTTETQLNGRKDDTSKVEIRITRGSSKSLARTVLPVTPMFSWSDGPDRFSVTTEDYACLNQDNLLNDSIIDFYLRYVFSTKTDDSLKKKCHVFSSFFYQRLTTRPPKVNGRKHPIEDDDSLSIKEKRHSRVKSWTKKVDIFEKDYLVIPINERNHWFLAIVCFPWLSGPVTAIDNQPIKLRPQQTYSKKITDQQRTLVAVNGESFHIGNTTVTPVNSNSKSTKDDQQITLNVDVERDEAESDEEELLCAIDRSPVEKLPEIAGPIKQPCILFFDSLAGSAHNRVATTLREYLMVEHQVKKMKPNEKSIVAFRKDAVKPFIPFTKESMISACLDVPQQNNSYDCGIFVLQYAEYFMKNPIPDYNLRNIKLSNWFPPHIAGRKRKNIQFLLIQLTKGTNPSADQVLNLLPRDDVRIALQDRSKTAAATNKENGENGSENKTEAMEEDGKSEVFLDKEKVEKGASPSNIVYDQEANNEMEK